MATITIKNLDKLTHKLNNISKVDVKKTMSKAVTLVHGEAKSLAPIGKTGDLAGSIRMDTREVVNGWEGRVYTNLEYAMYVEFGTGNRGNGSYPYKIDGINLAYKENWAGMKAQPYMYPALKLNEIKIRELFKEDVKDKLRDYCKGGK